MTHCKAEEAIARVREIHKPVRTPGYTVDECEACGDCCMVPYPCPTIAAIDAAMSNTGSEQRSTRS